MGRVGNIARSGLMMLTLLAGGAMLKDTRVTNHPQRTSVMSVDSQNKFEKFLSVFGFGQYPNISALIDRAPESRDLGYSEGLGYLILLGNAHESPSITLATARTVSAFKLRYGQGLTPWTFHRNGDRLEVLRDHEANSAIDGDMDIATGLIWSQAKGWGNHRDIQQMLNLIWPAMNFNGEVAIPGRSEDYGNGSVYGRIMHSASYFSLFEMEMFSRFDANETHNWMAVARSTMDIRRAMLGYGQDRTVPDFMYLSYDKKLGRYILDETGNTPRFRSKMGFDGIRTLLRIGLDCSLLEDAQLRQENIALARTVINNLGGTPEKVLSSIKDTHLYYSKEEIVDGKTVVVDIPLPGNREAVLAAYTALAYGAARGETNGSKYKNIFEYLRAAFEKEFDQGLLNNPEINDVADRYYDQALGQLTLALIEGAFERQPAVERFSPQRSKELQLLCANERAWPLSRANEYWLTFANFPRYEDRDSVARLVLQIRNELDWLQECDGASFRDLGMPRQESAEVLAEYQLQTGQNLIGARLINAAIWLDTKNLLGTDYPGNKELSEEIFKALNGALSESSFTPLEKVAFYTALLQKRPDHPLIKLGLCQAMLETYEFEYLDQRVQGSSATYPNLTEMARGLADNTTYDPAIRAEADQLLSQAYLRLALREVEKNLSLGLSNRQILERRDAIDGYFESALAQANQGLFLTPSDGTLKADLHNTLAEIYHERSRLKDHSLTNDFDNALTNYKFALETNQLSVEKVESVLVNISKLLWEQALRETVTKYDLPKHWHEYIDYLPETIKISGREDISLRAEISKDPAFIEALHLLEISLEKVKGKQVTPRSQLDRLALANLERVMAVEGSQSNRIATKDKKRNLRLALRLAQIVLLNFSVPEEQKLSEIDPVITDIGGLFPIGSMTGHLYRIQFFLNNRELNKALSDCESIIRLGDELADNHGRHLLNPAVLSSLIGLNQALLKEIQKGDKADINNLRSKLTGLLTILGRQNHNRLTAKLIEEVTPYTTPNPTALFLEDLRTLTERAIEENSLFEAAQSDPKISANLRQIRGQALRIKGLLKNGQPEEAAESVAEFLQDSSEEIPGSIFYRRLPDSLSIIAWAYYTKENPSPAIGIMLELLGEGQSELSDSAWIIRMLRDKQAKNYLNMAVKNDEFRQDVLFTIASMYRWAGIHRRDTSSQMEKYGEALKYLAQAQEYYLMAMGIDPQLAPTELPAALGAALDRHAKNLAIKNAYDEVTADIQTMNENFIAGGNRHAR